MHRMVAVSVGILVTAGCTGTPGSDAGPVGPAFDIAEARSGGNPDLFFAAPLATTPRPGDAGFDAGGSNAALRPSVRVCETDGAASPAGCVADVTAAVTGAPIGQPMTYDVSAEVYQVNWQTKSLDPAKDYRIEIWGLEATAAQAAGARAGTPGAPVERRWLFGWRDIRNSPSVASCTIDTQFCNVNYGQTIPVKARIEQFVFCPVERNCAVQFVANGAVANLQALLDPGTGAPSAQLFIPGQSGTDFAIAFEPCTAAEDAALAAAVDLPLFGPCLKTATTFAGRLSQAAVVSLCNQLDPSGFDLADPAQQDQLALHHVSADLALVQALPEAWQCGTPTSGVISAAPSGLIRLVRGVRDRVGEWLAPRPLMAAMLMIDRGGGGQTDLLGSFFKLGLPAAFRYERAADASQTGLAGSPHVLRARVTDLLGGPVKSARVRWTAVAPPTGGATVLGIVPAGSTPVLSDDTGLAQATVQLSATQGFNVFRASGRGIAAAECDTPSPTTGTCNGPRVASVGPPVIDLVDPFMPLHAPEFDPAGPETPIDIAEGTRLPFTVFGCTPGFGSAVVNGAFGPGEWACAHAQPFTANVSGGSTPATLFWMNDGTTLYLAVRVRRSAADRVNTLQFNFDNNDSWTTSGTGAAEPNDDVLSLDASAGFVDAYLTLKCTNSSQSSCWATDVSGGGASQGTGAVANDGTYTTYELAHPLTGDARDFSRSPGQTLGMFLTLQTGNGATGNTQFPGFRQYQRIRIASP